MNMTKNSAGGRAVSLSSEEGLAKIICVGMLGDKMTLVDEQSLISSIENLLPQCREEFIAKLAIYAKNQAKMKDVSSYLLAYLASIQSKYGPKVFSEIITDVSVLKKFIKFVRSGKTSRKSFGTSYKKLIQNYLDSRSDSQLFRESIGNDPSMSDIIKMVHPKPDSLNRDALYSYFVGKIDGTDKHQHLPSEVLEYISFCKNPIAYGQEIGKIPQTNIMHVMSHKLSLKQWESVALKMSFNQLIKNLVVLLEHGVFKNEKVLMHVYEKISSKEEAMRSNQLPYSIAMALKQLRNKAYQSSYGEDFQLKYQPLFGDISLLLSEALEKALANSFNNIPVFDANIALCIDVSGSMSDTISKKGVATYLDAASVLAMSFLAKNHKVKLLPFCTKVHYDHKISSQKSYLENFDILNKFSGGGTDCSAPIKYLNNLIKNNKDESVDLIIMISDNQSWHQISPPATFRSTPMLEEFNKYKKTNPDVKLVNIDISPFANTQASSSDSIFLISGFNDSIFKVLKDYLSHSKDANYWVNHINSLINL